MNGQKRAWRAISLLAATLAAITLAFLAGCSPGKRDGASERLVAVNAVSNHLPFGNPSQAGSDPDNRCLAATATGWAPDDENL